MAVRSAAARAGSNSRGNNRDYNVSIAGAIALYQQDALPGAELKLPAVDWNRQARSDYRADHVIRRVRRIVLVTELDPGNDSLEHFHQVLISAFSRFSGREPGCRVSDEDVAQSFSDSEFRNALLYAIGDVEHLFIAPSGHCNGLRRHA